MKRIIELVSLLRAFFLRVSQPNHSNKVYKKEAAPKVTVELESYLRDRYHFRYNELTDETELRPAGSRSAFQPVTQRTLNSICMDAIAKGIPCWDRDLTRFIYSDRIESYQPFREYMDNLPAWDGVDRLIPLAHRVSANAVWTNGFHTWMLGMAAQWMGLTGLHANSVAPILVSSEQGRLKSTFCKSLMPPALLRYYKDDVKLGTQGQADRLLVEMGLLNLDEFDKYSATSMPLLKNLMQMSTVNLRKAYARNFRTMPRMASFIGTSNRKDLLTDPTGSRRFLCVEVEHKIDCTHLEYEQVFAQLKAELLDGARYWFNKEEERELQFHNGAFYRQSPMEEVLRGYYRRPQGTDEQFQLLSAADIFKKLKKHNPAAMRGSNPNALAQALVAVGIERKHTTYGNVYKVVRF